MRILIALLALTGCAATATELDASKHEAAAVHAAEDPVELAPAGPPIASEREAKCASPDHHAFDFWIGRWDVHDPEGKLVGHNHIQAIHGGCALREEWSGESGSRGTSLNLYDASRGVWHQTWVDNSGGLLVLEGDVEGERMVLRGETREGDARTLQEIVWAPLADGRVEQRWRASSDGGETWDDVFVGLYSSHADPTQTKP